MYIKILIQTPGSSKFQFYKCNKFHSPVDIYRIYMADNAD